MKTYWLAIVLAVALLTPSMAFGEDLESLYGTWVMKPEQARTMPYACRNSGYTITRDKITMRSGELEVTTAYVAERQGELFILRQRNAVHNSRPNCQGVAAKDVVGHFVWSIHVVPSDGRLRFYFVRYPRDPFIEFVRR